MPVIFTPVGWSELLWLFSEGPWVKCHCCAWWGVWLEMRTLRLDPKKGCTRIEGWDPFPRGRLCRDIRDQGKHVEYERHSYKSICKGKQKRRQWHRPWVGSLLKRKYQWPTTMSLERHINTIRSHLLLTRMPHFSYMFGDIKVPIHGCGNWPNYIRWELCSIY